MEGIDITNYIARGRQVVIPLTNKSAGAVAAGDTVILSSGTAAAFTTTTSAGQSADWVGVVYDASIAQDAIGLVILNGYVPLVTLSGAASLGDYLETHSVAKQSAPTGTRSAGAFGQVLGTGTTPAAYIWGVPDPASGAGGDVATDAIWDAAGDLVQGTGADTAARLPIGTANQLLRVNSGATGIEYAGIGRVLISEQTPTGTGTVTWSSIPATYKSLEIEFIARSTKAAVFDQGFLVYLNNDTTAGNYRYGLVNGYQTTVARTQGDGATAGFIPAANAPANSCGQYILNILNYAGTTFNKQIHFQGGYRYDASTLGNVQQWLEVEWESNVAVNRVDIVLATDSFVTGSTFGLYGVY